jgi:hypothetical protein
MKLRLIGYWCSTEGEDGWPDPNDFIDWSWDEEERRQIVRYLSDAGVLLRAYRGKHVCRLCGERHGSLQMSDGDYLWPDGLTHYVVAHGVRLPEDFVQHVTSRSRELLGATVDALWWRDQAPQPVNPRTPS